MITFEQARQIVEDDLRKTWNPDDGTLVTLPTGSEDAMCWRVFAGARESMIEGDHDFDLFDFPALLVSKGSGHISRLSVIENLDRLNRMTPTT
jgi:hypothetical protein